MAIEHLVRAVCTNLLLKAFVLNDFLWVFLTQTHQSADRFDRKFAKTAIEMLHSTPLKSQASHWCLTHHKTVLSFLFPIIRQLMGKRLRRRIILHYGVDTALAGELSQYGMKAENIPADIGGKWPREKFERWVEKKLETELAYEHSQTRANPLSS